MVFIAPSCSTLILGLAVPRFVFKENKMQLRQNRLIAGCVPVLAFALVSACTSSSVELVSEGQNTNIQVVKQDLNEAKANAAALKAQGSSDGLTALGTNLQLEKRLLGDYDLIKQVSSQLSTNNIYDETLQPVNKKEKCLLPFLVNDSGADVQLYWDGQCFRGLAQGLGRVVRTIDGKKTQEMLVEISPKQKNTLVIYLRYDVINSDSEVGYSLLTLKDNKLEGHSATWGYNDQSWQDGNYESISRYEDTSNFMSYTKITDLLNGEYSSIIAYPNFSHDVLNAHDNVMSNLDRTYRLLEGNAMIGLSYIWLKNGRLLVKNNNNGQDNLVQDSPKSLEQYVDRLESQVSSKIAGNRKLVELGFSKIEQYGKKKCRQLNAFFRGDEVNNVCDYIDNVGMAFEDFLKAQEQRSLQIDSFHSGQKQRLKELEQQLRVLKTIKLKP